MSSVQIQGKSKGIADFRERSAGRKEIVDQMIMALELIWIDNNKSGAQRILRTLEYGVEDVQALVYRIDGHSFYGRNVCEDAGRFVSARLRQIMKDKDVVRLRMGQKQLNRIASHHKKGTLVIFGDVGYEFGYMMRSGKVILYGKASGPIGLHKTGGELSVEKPITDMVRGETENESE